MTPLTRNPQLGAWTETEKTGFLTNKKVQAVAETTDKLFYEEKRAGFYIESRDPTGDSGLTRIPQLDARTETEKTGFLTNKKVQAVAGTTDKLFYEEKRAGFYIESRDPTGDSGLNVLAT